MPQTNRGPLTIIASWLLFQDAVVKWPLLVHYMMRKQLEQFFSMYLRQINYDFPQQWVSKLMTRLNKRQISHPLPITLGKGSQEGFILISFVSWLNGEMWPVWPWPLTWLSSLQAGSGNNSGLWEIEWKGEEIPLVSGGRWMECILSCTLGVYSGLTLSCTLGTVYRVTLGWATNLKY